jgi:dipeptidyl aminopeptidase/acylaminoacyl peptidase
MVYIEQHRRFDMVRYELDLSTPILEEPLPLVQGRNPIWPDSSPDGEWVVFFEGMFQGQQDIAIVRLDGTGYRKLTDGPGSARHPRWSPDGRRIAFDSTRSGKYEIWTIEPDGSDAVQLTTSGTGERALYPVWSSDGSFLAYQKGRGLGSVIIPVHETAEDTPVPRLAEWSDVDSEFIAWSWSSDGSRLAGWRRMKSDGREAGIVLYSFESREYESLTEFGRSPVWLRDDLRLIFWDDYDAKLFLLDSKTTQVQELAPSVPAELLLGAVSPDEQYLYASIRINEADIWMLTLNEER